VDNPVAITLKIVAVGVSRLGVTASARLLDWDGVSRGHFEILALSIQHSVVKAADGARNPPCARRDTQRRTPASEAGA
jgi:hypothetical protein